MQSKATRGLAAFLVAVLLLSSLAGLSVSAASNTPAQLHVTDGVADNLVWNYGYVGSYLNSSGYADRICSGNVNGTYRYTDLITVPKAGTTLSWREPSTGTKVSQNAYVVSSWKEQSGTWVLDTEGACIPGGIYGASICTSVGGYSVYTYTTTSNNEHIRLCCYGTAGSAVAPTVTVGGSTVTDGALSDILWFSGYVGSGTNGNVSYRNAIAVNASAYTYSAPICLPKAGTTISFETTLAVSTAAYAFSVWERDANGSLAFGFGMAGAGDNNSCAWQTKTSTGYRYFYTSSYDNEFIRITYKSNAAEGVLPATFPTVSVTENSGGDPILAMSYYDPTHYQSIRSVAWKNGYVGSASQGSAIKSSDVYKYTDIIPVWGAGSLVMFTDFTPASTGGAFASNGAYVFSSWRSATDSSTVADTTGANFDGSNTAHYTDNPDGSRTYYYYTTKDVEYLRLSMRSDGSNRGTVNTGTNVSFIAPAVYVLSSASLATWTKGQYVLGNPNASWGSQFDTLENDNFAISSYFTLPRAGMTVTIPLLANSSPNIAVFSTYDKNGETYTGKTAVCPADGTYTTVGTTRRYTYTTTRNNETLRITTNKSFTPTAGNPFLPVVATTVGAWDAQLQGKEAVIIGDSYFAGNGIDPAKVWPQHLARLYNMTLYNYGINGSTISNYVTTNTPMVNRYSSMAGGSSTALVLFEGGRNDYNQSVPLGTSGDTDSHTFYGAIHTMLTGLLQKYPNALIVCLNAWDLTGLQQNSANAAGHTCNEYAAAFCSYVNSLENDRVIMLNSNDTSVVPIYLKDESFRTLYAQTPGDISHMNPLGHTFALPFFEKLIGGFMQSYQSATAAGSIRFTENGTTTRLVSSATSHTATVKAPMLSGSGIFIGWGGTLNGESVFLPEGGTLSVSANDSGTLTPYYLEMTSAGSTVRLTTGSTGVRFLTDLNKTQYDAIAALPGVNLTQGTLIVPQFYLASLGNELTFASLQANGKKHLNVSATGWYSTEGTTATLAGSVANIFENHYSLDYVGQGYVTVTYTDGTSVTFYATGANANTTSVYNLATAALADRSDTQEGLYQFETAEGDYSPYTAAQREVLTAFTSVILEIRMDATTESGFAAAQPGSDVAYTVTYNELGDLLTVARADGEAITDTSFTGVVLCGEHTTYTVKNGKIEITYSVYSKRY